MGWINKLICWWYGHDIYLDDVGGAHIQCCRRCPWSGRVTYDPFVDEEERKRIKFMNQACGVLGPKK